MPETLENFAPALSATTDAPVVEQPEPVVATPDPASEAPAEVATEPAAEPATESEVEVEVEAAPEPAPRVDPRTRKIRELEDALAAAQEAKRQQDAERDARMERLLSALEAQQRPAETKPTETPPVPKPQREAFDNPDDYDAALIEWSAARSLDTYTAEQAKRDELAKAEAAKAEQERALRQRVETAHKSWTDRRAAFIESHPDYVEVAESDALPINEAIASVILMNPKGPELAYWLGQNPQEVPRLAEIATRDDLVFEMGLIAAKLTPQPKPQVSKAPAPITPLGNRNAAAEADPEQMSGDEYFNQRIDQHRSVWKPSGIGRQH